jgi:hypothetical protein
MDNSHFKDFIIDMLKGLGDDACDRIWYNQGFQHYLNLLDDDSGMANGLATNSNIGAKRFTDQLEALEVCIKAIKQEAIAEACMRHAAERRATPYLPLQELEADQANPNFVQEEEE